MLQRVAFLVLTDPVTNAIVGRSFSTLKMAKTSMLSTMINSRLNHLLMIHIYNDEPDEINMKLITNKFIKVKESKIATFGLII